MQGYIMQLASIKLRPQGCIQQRWLLLLSTCAH